MKPFNLEAFKAGQKALTRDGRVATFIGVCDECRASNRLVAHIHGYDSVFTYFASGVYPDEDNRYSLYDLVSMVSRHQALIDAYDPEDTWQEGITSYGNLSRNTYTIWLDIDKPNWDEGREYRLHPHNDLIKAQRNGAIIEKWVEAHRPCWFTCYGEPDWDERATYRVMPEVEKTAAFMRGYNNTLKILNKRRDCRTKAKTKTVYEWMWKNTEGYWVMADILSTKEEAANYYSAYEYKKTGRSWEVEV